MKPAEKTYTFYKGEELLTLCRAESLPISEIMLRRELLLSDVSREAVHAELMETLATMRTSVQRGLTEELSSVSGLTGGDAERFSGYAGRALMGETLAHAVAASMAVVEVNASMGRIVAAPTAGASGILPGVLLTYAEARSWNDEALCSGLLTAGAIGMLIACGASISGAEGGCQAEIGSASSMAAGALTYLENGDNEQIANASALAMKNMLGLTCDPVAGLVEVPCIKRNVSGAVNAIISCQMSMAGIKSAIPVDEVFETMGRIGKLIPACLRETSLEGLAATPSALKR